MVLQNDLRDTELFKRLQQADADWLQLGARRRRISMTSRSRPMAAPSPAAASSRRRWKDRCRSAFAWWMSIAASCEVVSAGPNIDMAPKWSPDGRSLAYLSDRDEAGVRQLCLLDLAQRRETRVTIEELWMEYAHWSPDGATILIGAAERGVDLSGFQGGYTFQTIDPDRCPIGAPQVDVGVDDSQWRSLWIYEVAQRHAPPPDGQRSQSVGGAAGPAAESIACIASDNPHENDWYKASVRLIDLATGKVRIVYAPKDQIGWLSASPSGQSLALVDFLLQRSPVDDGRSAARLGEGRDGAARGHDRCRYHLHRLAKRERMC